MAQFQVTQTSRTEDTFLIRGTLLEVQIHEGMEIRVSLNNSLQVTAGINELKEINDLYDIVIGCSDQDEIELWEMLNLNGDVLNIC